MKRTLILAIALFSMSVAASAQKSVDGTKIIETKKSTVNWKGEKVTGEHNGTIAIKSGSLEMKDNKLTGGTVVMDMTSIVVTDLSGEYKGKLEGHLKSDDFFGVEKYPESTLVIKDVKESDKKGSFVVNGDMTIKGITNPISFTTTMMDDKDKIVANANIIIDRAKYNIRYGSGSFFDNLGDKTIYDEFTLTVNLVTK